MNFDKTFGKESRNLIPNNAMKKNFGGGELSGTAFAVDNPRIAKC